MWTEKKGFTGLVANFQCNTPAVSSTNEMLQQCYHKNLPKTFLQIQTATLHNNDFRIL